MRINYNPFERATNMQQLEFADDILFRLLTSYVILLYSIQILTITASIMKLPINAWGARLILALAIVLATILFFIPKFSVKGRLASKPRLSRFLIWGFVGICIGVYVVLWAVAYHMPDLSWDGNAYHIPTIAMWDQVGYIHWVKTTYLESLINGYPKGAELVAYVLVKAFNNQLINTVNLIFLPPGILGIMLLSRRLGARVPLAGCAGLAFILIPVNIGQSPTTYVDSTFASSAIGFLALTLSLAKSPGLNIKKLGMFGASMGLMISVKSTGLALAGLGLLALCIMLIIALRRTGQDEHQPPKTSMLKSAFVIIMMLLATGIIVLAGGYWYIRNYLITGSPLYPVGLKVFGINLFPGLSISETIYGIQNTPAKIQTWPVTLQVLYIWAQSLGDWPASILGYDNRSGGLGFLWILGCVPSIVLFIVSSLTLKRGGRWEFAILFAITVITFLNTPLLWWARYTLWIYALGLPCLAYVFDGIIGGVNSTINKIGKVWMALCIGILVLEAGYSTVNVIALASPQSIPSILTHLFDKSVWEWPTAYLFPDMQGTIIEDILSENEPVAMGPYGSSKVWHFVGLVGQLSQPIGARQLIFLDETDIQNKLISNVVKDIIWDKTMPLPAGLEALAVKVDSVDEFVILTLR